MKKVIHKKCIGVLLLACLLLSFAKTTSATNNSESAYSPGEMNVKWSEFERKSQVKLSRAFPYMKCFENSSKKHQLPLALMLAIARGESNFDTEAVSKANAIGVMQIQWPGTAKHLGIKTKTALYRPCVNIEAGTRYFAELLTRYKGNIYLALAAYNYGPTRIKPQTKPTQLPSGAHWYASYIYDHLDYIKSTNTLDYQSIQQRTLISFVKAYRAKHFTEYMRDIMPESQIDWFKRTSGKYDIIFSFKDEKEYRAAQTSLKKYGFDFNK